MISSHQPISIIFMNLQEVSFVEENEIVQKKRKLRKSQKKIKEIEKFSFFWILHEKLTTRNFFDCFFFR